MKHQKSTTIKLVLHIYRKYQYHLSTAIGKLIVVAFFFGMRPWEYSTNPKSENKITHILRKGSIRFYRKLASYCTSVAEYTYQKRCPLY